MSRRSRVVSGALLFMIAMVLWPTQVSVWAQLSTTPSGPPTVVVNERGLISAPAAKLPTEAPTVMPRSSATALPTPLQPSPVPTRVTAAASSTPVSTAPASFTPTATSSATSTPSVSSFVLSSGNSNPPVNVADSILPILTQAMSVGGFVLGLAVLGLIIWISLTRLSCAITNEIRTESLATLRMQHEAERIERHEKVLFRADSDVLSLLEQAILDATSEIVSVHLLPHGWLASPPLMAVIDQEQARYIFSPTPPNQVQAIARRQGLAQLLLGQATDLTAYPIDALNSTPFIADDLSGAYGYVLARHQAPRRPLPRTDRWYLYLARPKASRWPRRFERQMKQTGSLRRFTDRLHDAPDSKPSSSTVDHTTTPSGPPPASTAGGHTALRERSECTCGQPGD